jgi:hypothetical protein
VGNSTLDHLELHDPSIIQEVRRMEESTVKREVSRSLKHMLREQGLEKGHGLQKRMSDLLKVTQPTVARVLRDIDQEV